MEISEQDKQRIAEEGNRTTSGWNKWVAFKRGAEYATIYERQEIERLKNDLADALDLKNGGMANSALEMQQNKISKLKTERQEWIETLKKAWDGKKYDTSPKTLQAIKSLLDKLNPQV